MKNKDLTSLINSVKNTEHTVRTQKVTEEKYKADEKIFSLYIPTEKLKELKIISAKSGTSIKKLINLAIDDKYFTTTDPSE